MKRLNNFIKSKLDEKVNLKNIIEATEKSAVIKRIVGLSAYDLSIDLTGIVKSHFNFKGASICLLFLALYFYTSYVVYEEDQTILRNLFNSKFKQYGDILERIIASSFVIYSLCKVSFLIKRDTINMQIVVDIDSLIKELQQDPELVLDKVLDYNRDASLGYSFVIFHVLIAFVHFVSLWLTQLELKVKKPLALMYQIVYADSMCLVMSSCYCYYLILLKERYHIVNACMVKLVDNTKKPNLTEVIRTCTKIYNLLHWASRKHDKMFGFALIFTTFASIIYLILNLFYLIEAIITSDLYETNRSRFMYFSLYVLWEVSYAVCILCVNIYFCESTNRVARRPPNIAHRIIVSNISPDVNTTAMQLSQQVLHQNAKFTAGGLFRMEYKLILQTSKFVSTILVILVQNATLVLKKENKKNIS